jgi:hypothetical protein
LVVADYAGGGVFGGGDEFVGEEGHVFGFEDAFFGRRRACRGRGRGLRRG